MELQTGKHFYIYFDYKLSSEPSQEFHVYGLEWDKKNIKWYIHVVANSIGINLGCCCVAWIEIALGVVINILLRRREDLC